LGRLNNISGSEEEEKILVRKAPGLLKFLLSEGQELSMITNKGGKKGRRSRRAKLKRGKTGRKGSICTRGVQDFRDGEAVPSHETREKRGGGGRETR